ncbi:lipocalin-like domain-containing protein [Dinoroseobacter sp. S375]|uniref:lipocalin-like domain-containing protein n=1 Tax=Dinoroseobacter sp. S375 TaxID=3415136 RepID=UPI003C7BD272
MNVSALWMALALLFAPVAALGQGFAGLGSTTADGFAQPAPDPVFDFPTDHGPHPDYRIEWWYLTANLRGADGRDYGLQWTLFRSALEPRRTEGWDSPQIWMGHAGLTTPERHFVAERFARDGTGQAGVTAEPFAAWIDDWQMTGLAPVGADAISALRLTASGRDFAYDMTLNAEGPLVPQGAGGYSVKSASGQASYYYSQPFYRLTGTLTLPDGPVEVSGTAWLDREWSSQPLDEGQTGWDWFSLHLEGGDKVMGFRLRDRAGADYTAATWIAPDGTPDPLPNGAFQVTEQSVTEVAGRQVPTEWRVQIPSRGLDIVTRPLNAQSWMDTLFPYWEGPIRFEGSHRGQGYLEMTGYE